MQIYIYNLFFVFILMVTLSALVSAGNIYVNEGKIILEGEFGVNSSENSTAFISEEGNSVVIDQPLEKISLDEDSLDKAEVNYINQEKSEINSKEQSSKKESALISGAVIGSASKDYILFILMIIIAVISILIGLKIWKNKKSKLINTKLLG